MPIRDEVKALPLEFVADVAVYRVSILTSRTSAAIMYAEMGMTKDDSDYFLAGHSADEKEIIAQHIQQTFETRKIFHFRRFSRDFAALYSALEEATARCEIDHWIPSIWGAEVQIGASVAYSVFSVVLTGKIKDLRPLLDRYPGLRYDDYRICHEAADQVRRDGADALYSYSSRHVEGTCCPIYAEFALKAGQRCSSVVWQRQSDGRFVMQ